MTRHHTWLAIVMPESELGWPLDIEAAESRAWQTWARQRDLKIIAECSTQARARERIAQWLSMQEEPCFQSLKHGSAPCTPLYVVSKNPKGYRSDHRSKNIVHGECRSRINPDTE